MRILRERTWQVTPSNDLDELGDPIPPRYRTSYEERDAGGFWWAIPTAEAETLLAAGEATLIEEE